MLSLVGCVYYGRIRRVLVVYKLWQGHKAHLPGQGSSCAFTISCISWPDVVAATCQPVRGGALCVVA